jgi:hypothetical protein
MTDGERLPITVWPGVALPYPSYTRRRYALVHSDDSTRLVAQEVVGSEPASGETCLRLAEARLDTPESMLVFANEAGTVGFLDVEETTLGEFELTAVAMRDAVSAWRTLRGADPVELPWHLPRFAGVTAVELRGIAGEYLNDLLETGLAAFTPAARIGSPEEGVDLTLHEVCCLELFNHVVSRDEFAVCASETCNRLFVLDEKARKRGVLYCSRACARAQAQREFRRRRSAGRETAA